MERKDKLNLVKNYFKGIKQRIHPVQYMPTKTVMWYAETPDLYFYDDGNGKKALSAADLEELEKKYFVIIIKIFKTAEEVGVEEMR